jgi:hypothetical protein
VNKLDGGGIVVIENVVVEEEEYNQFDEIPSFDTS